MSVESSIKGSGRNTFGSQSTGSSTSTTSGSGADNHRRRNDYGKKDRKIVRILTVIAYIVAVSLAAVLLSAYYMFLWNPDPRDVHSPDLSTNRGTSSSSSSHGSSSLFSSHGAQQHLKYRAFHAEGTSGEGGPNGRPTRDLMSFLIQNPSLTVDLDNEEVIPVSNHGNTKSNFQKQVPTPGSTPLNITRKLNSSLVDVGQNATSGPTTTITTTSTI